MTFKWKNVEKKDFFYIILSIRKIEDWIKDISTYIEILNNVVIRRKATFFYMFEIIEISIVEAYYYMFNILINYQLKYFEFWNL